MTLRRQTAVSFGLAVLLAGCAASPGQSLMGALTSSEQSEFVPQPGVVTEAPPPSGLIDETERVETMDRLRALADANAAAAGAPRPTADQLANLRDTHAQLAEDEIEGGLPASSGGN